MLRLFFGDTSALRDVKLGVLLAESWPGLLLSFVLGCAATLLADLATVGDRSYADALVVAVVIGMAGRRALNALPERHQIRLLPGIILAQLALVPVGIVLYGAKNFDARAIAALSTRAPRTLILVAAAAVASFAGVAALARALGQKPRMAFLLGFSAAICGSSAIAVTAPLCKTDPDETSTALVANTLLAVVFYALFTRLLLHSVDPALYANLVGSLSYQTGFVKMALLEGPRELATLGLLLKTTRVSFLIVGIPVVVYLLDRRVLIPWYMVLFVVSGVLVSYGAPPKPVMSAISAAYSIVFASALASVGLNAEVKPVVKRLWAPVAALALAFGAAAALVIGLSRWSSG
jgi:uncharacterized integral membrane protein (TIGR00698 family)